MLNQALVRNAQIHPARLAVVAPGRHRTWSVLRDDVARLAFQLNQRGVGRGDRVALLAANSDRYLEVSMAVSWAGAVLTPLNTRWSQAELVYALSDCKASLLIVDESFASQGLEAAAVAAIPVAQAPVAYAVVDIDNLFAGRSTDEAPLVRLAPTDMAGVYYTGGTTGAPKGVMVSPQGLWASGIAFMAEAGISARARYLHVAPMFHLADVALSLAGTIAGATHYFLPTFEPAATLKAVAEHRITHLLLVPTMLRMVLAHPDCGDADLTSLECLAYGASPIDETTLLDAIYRLPECGFIQGYGQSELSPLISVLPPERHTLEGPAAGKLRSAGRASLCVELEVVRSDDTPAPSMEVGEVRVRGPGAMLGYWNKPEETAATLRDGWVYTGDAGYLDGDGFLFLVDRLKDMIVSGGENVYSAEVENVLAAHPAVGQVAVIGVPDERWGERVHAIIILRPDRSVEPQELIDWCRGRIANYKAPRSVSLREEPFPLSAAGKVLKRALRAPFWPDNGRLVS
ncbi:class I adenylate-forming enzyme family protein [Phenylobacterium sp.]|uniref:class I adenylate-forming enzyme family protein n=1 Tax=Phenylobacterium sp. TaxID=1871053 RepID=UPI002FC65EDB